MRKIKYIYASIILISLFILTEMTKNDELITITNNVELAYKNEQTPKEEIENLIKKYNNEDVVGQIEILNTSFKQPIVQGINNDYYLRRSPSKLYDINGSIFLDYRTNINGKKIIIYGHNDQYLTMPFDILENYYDIDYLNKHKKIKITTKEKIRTYEIFSIYIETKDFSYMDVDLDPNQYNDHLKYLKNKSMYEIDTQISNNDNILILQTCSTHKDYQKYSKKYLIIALKEIKSIS